MIKVDLRKVAGYERGGSNMSASVVHEVKYITDEIGKRQEVIIPFKIWKSITKELEKLREKQRILLGLQQACREAKIQEKGELPTELR